MVTITGAGFTNATAVNFGKVAATSFVVDSDTQITAISPAEAAGNVNVTVVTASGTSATSSADVFSYVAVAAPAASADLGGETANTGLKKSLLASRL